MSRHVASSPASAGNPAVAPRSPRVRLRAGRRAQHARRVQHDNGLVLLQPCGGETDDMSSVRAHPWTRDLRAASAESAGSYLEVARHAVELGLHNSEWLRWQVTEQVAGEPGEQWVAYGAGRGYEVMLRPVWSSLPSPWLTNAPSTASKRDSVRRPPRQQLGNTRQEPAVSEPNHAPPGAGWPS